MRRSLLFLALMALGLGGLASPAAGQQACATGGGRFGFQQQCTTNYGAFTLAPGQLFLGGPVMYGPSFYDGGLYGTSAYGAGGASVRPGGWYPQVAGAPINAAQQGAFLTTGVSNIGLGLPANVPGLVPWGLGTVVGTGGYGGYAADLAVPQVAPTVTYVGEALDGPVVAMPGR